MRIALCLEYPLQLRGGVSVLVETLLREFAARGHEIILVSPDAEETIRDLETSKWIHTHIQFYPEKNSIAEAKALARQIAGARPDVAHFHSGGVFVWGARFPFRSPLIYLDRLGVPCFSTVHLVVGLLEGYCGPKKPFWFKALLLPLAWTGKMQQLWHTRREIAVSQHDFKKLRRWYWPLKNRFTQIYHSRLNEIPACEDARPTEVLPREKIVLNVGHIAWRKGQGILAEAFARIAPRHRDWILQLAGHYTDEVTVRQIRKLIAERKLEDRILLLGERADAGELMRRAGIYGQPSFWEGLPLALQEAMFYGCPAIASQIEAHEELIQPDKTGLQFEPGNVAQLAVALEELIVNKSRREQFGSAAAASIRERGMTAGQMAENYLRLYESIQ